MILHCRAVLLQRTAEEGERRARLFLVDLAQRIISDICSLLGIHCPEEMQAGCFPTPSRFVIYVLLLIYSKFPAAACMLMYFPGPDTLACAIILNAIGTRLGIFWYIPGDCDL